MKTSNKLLFGLLLFIVLGIFASALRMKMLAKNSNVPNTEIKVEGEDAPHN